MNHCIIGPVPPPLGGISVYVYRLSQKLRAEGHRVRNIDLSGGSIMKRLSQLALVVFDPRPTAIDLHAFDFSAMFAALVRPFAKKITYMDHNTLLYKRSITGVRARILREFLETAEEVAFVSEEGYKHYSGQGFKFSRSVVRNAYLAPPVGEQQRILATYDPDTLAFLKSRRPLIVANASQLVFVDDEDLYGLDLCAELVIRLRSQHPNIGLLFALANSGPHSEYKAEIARKLTGAGASESFHFLSEQRELWPVFRTASLMVRPTTGDGFAISIAEALELGCPVLASDAVIRPTGVELFRSRDMDDFESKARAMLGTLKATNTA